MSNDVWVYGVDPDIDAKLRKMVDNPDVWKPGMTLEDAMFSGGVLKVKWKFNNNQPTQPHVLVVKELHLEEIECLD